MVWRYLSFALVCCALIAPARAQERLPVVASFSILGDLVRNVGGERIALTTLVGPGGDAHVFTPRPADASRVANAKLVFINGLGFEGWLPRLVKAGGGSPEVVVASNGVVPLRDSSGPDPHAWQSVTNAKTYVINIRDALAAADPDNAAGYRASAEAYLARLDALDREVRDAVAKIPAERRRVISPHSAFRYFAAGYGVAFIAPQGVSTESEPSARDIADIVTQIRRDKIPAVFLENVTDTRLIQRIAADTGAKVGGTLYSDSLTDEKGDAPTYIDMVRHNIKTLTQALAP